jgi:hypothetical protein
VRRDVLDYAGLGSPVPVERLAVLSAIAADLRETRTEAERSLSRRLRDEFARKLRQADDEVIRTHAGGRSLHAILEDAVLYLLRDGPKCTRDLHPEIQRIHPDLCDDAEDRVIDGRHFGKKWKHAVRTAQQHLKARGLIEYRAGVWHRLPD